MLRRIYIDNYKCFVNFTLELKELTLLTGVNGVGKSAVLDVLEGVQRVLMKRGKVFDRGMFSGKTLTRWQSVDVQIVELEVKAGGDVFVYRLEIEHDAERKRARVNVERLTVEGKPLFSFERGEVQLYRDNHSEGPKFPTDWTESALGSVMPKGDNKRLTKFLDFMEKAIICRIYPNAMGAESQDEEQRLERDGANFASWLRHMMQERYDLMGAYVDEMKEIIDGLTGIRLEKTGIQSRALMLVIRSGGAQYELGLDEVSDGQRVLLVLYALIHLTANQGYALFLDEPENYVGLLEMQPWLQKLRDACGEKIPQAVLCSHHPELIDYLGEDCGLLLRREVTNSTVVKPLTSIGLDGALSLSQILARGWDQ